MTLKKFDKFDTPDDIKNLHEDIKNNLSLDDLGPGNLQTTAPTTSTLGKGRYRHVEENGVPVTYYRTVAGVLYKQTWTAV